MTVIESTKEWTAVVEGYVKVHYVGLLILLNREQIKIGKGVAFNYGCYLNGSGKIEIGAETKFGPYCMIHSENHGGDKRPVKIGEDCWFGCGVQILPGAQIGHNTTIGGGSVVSGDIPSDCVAVGNPAKVVRDKLPVTKVPVV